jgi:alpha-tubulin suppressor-like RCC1 family protein
MRDNLKHVISISAGAYHSMALLDDGMVRFSEARGHNNCNQCDVPQYILTN